MLFIFGVFLVIDDLFLHNIGVIQIYSIRGLHIHHSIIGTLLMLASSISVLFIIINDTGVIKEENEFKKLK